MEKYFDKNCLYISKNIVFEKKLKSMIYETITISNQNVQLN